MINTSLRCVAVVGAALWLANATAIAAENEMRYNQVRFQAEASERVANDWMTATLYVYAEQRDPAALANQINNAMGWALQQAKGKNMVKVSSGTYRTYPTYDKTRLVSWRAEQDVVLDSAAFTDLTALVGVLQERLQVRGMSFSVSPERRRSVEDALINRALNEFKQRAELIQKNLAGKGYRLVDINVNTGGTMPSPMMMRAPAMAMAEAAAPAVEGGESTLTVTVNGLIELQ